jgi:hypothetical protein
MWAFNFTICKLVKMSYKNQRHYVIKGLNNPLAQKIKFLYDKTFK